MSTRRTDWMQQIYEDIKWRTLCQVCLPFSHDSGMSQINISEGIPGYLIRTQDLTIGGQLNAGARFFDIRPFQVNSTTDNSMGYFSSHGTFNGNNWLGAGGQSLIGICNEINAFTSQNAELVILELSHGIVGTTTSALLAMGYDPNIFMPPLPNPMTVRSVQRMQQNPYQQLFRFLLARIHNLYVCPDPHADLTQLPMSDFIGEGKAAVIITLSDDGIIIPDELHGQGLYYGSLSTDIGTIRAAAASGRRSQLYYTGSYSNSNVANYVDSDQFNKLNIFRGDRWLPPFLLEFTMTQSSDATIVLASIEDMAKLIKPKLFKDLSVNITPDKYPTMIGVDFFESRVTDLAFNINKATPTGDNWYAEVVSAFYGPQDVTLTVHNSFQDWIHNDSSKRLDPQAVNWADTQFTVYSTAPYTIVVNNENPLLGPDPLPMVPKRLVVLLRRVSYTDDCLSYLMHFSAGEGETMTLDPREMNLRKSCAQFPERISNQKQAVAEGGELQWQIAYAMYGPIDQCATEVSGEYIGPIIGSTRVDIARLCTLTNTSGPLSAQTCSLVVNFQKVMQWDQGAPGEINGKPIPYQLRVMLIQWSSGKWPQTGTSQFNKANTATYRLVTALEGETMTLGATQF